MAEADLTSVSCSAEMVKPRGTESEETLEEPRRGEEEVDVEAEANAFVREALKGLIGLIKNTKDQELIRITHGYIHCLKNFYTLEEMVLYMLSTTSATEEKEKRCYLRCISDDDLGGKAYLKHSAYRQTQRNSSLNLNVQKQRQAPDSHVCEPENKVGTSHTSKMKRKPRKH